MVTYQRPLSSAPPTPAGPPLPLYNRQQTQAELRLLVHGEHERSPPPHKRHKRQVILGQRSEQLWIQNERIIVLREKRADIEKCVWVSWAGVSDSWGYASQKARDWLIQDPWFNTGLLEVNFQLGGKESWAPSPLYASIDADKDCLMGKLQQKQHPHPPSYPIIVFPLLPLP